MRRRAVRSGFAALLTMVCCLGWATHAGAEEVFSDEVPRKTPILLIYGFQPVPGFYAPSLWTAFIEEFSGRPADEVERVTVDSGHVIYRQRAATDDDRDVYVSDYCVRYEPTFRDVRFYAARLAEEMEWIRAADGVESFVVIGHSTGGLIARCYIEAADFESVVGTDGFTDLETVYAGDVQTLVTLSTPHHGVEYSVGSWFSTMTAQLKPGSDLLSVLNVGEAGDAVPYISMAGQSCLGCALRRDATGCRVECIEEALAWEGSDLVVTMSSAYLPNARNVACIGFDHVDMHTSSTLAGVIKAMLDSRWSADVVFGSAELAGLYVDALAEAR